MASILIPLGLALLMLAVGLETHLTDFRALVRAPGAVTLGLALQLVGLPGLAFGLAELFALPPDAAVGLVLVAAAPGGVTANFATLMARGDVALAVTLTVVTSLLAPLVVPLWAGLAFARLAAEQVTLVLPLGPTVGAILAVTVLPLLVGATLAHRLPVRVAAARPLVRRLSTAVFLAIVAAAILAQWSALVAFGADLFGPTLALNLAGLTAVLVLGRLLGIAPARIAAIALSTGLRNVALALTVAITLLGRPDVAVAATVYVVVMNLVALAVIVPARRRALVTDQGGDRRDAVE